MLQCEDASNLSYCRKESMMYINQQYDGNYGTCQEKNKCITGNVTPSGISWTFDFPPPPPIPSVERGVWILSGATQHQAQYISKYASISV